MRGTSCRDTTRRTPIRPTRCRAAASPSGAKGPTGKASHAQQEQRPPENLFRSELPGGQYLHAEGFLRIYLVFIIEIVAPDIGCGMKQDDVQERPCAVQPIYCLVAGKQIVQCHHYRHGRRRKRPRADGHQPFAQIMLSSLHFPVIIFLISLSLFSASIGVRLFRSKFFISSRIWLSTGSSSWKKLSW